LTISWHPSQLDEYCLRRAVLYPAELLVQRGRNHTHLRLPRPWQRPNVRDSARM